MSFPCHQGHHDGDDGVQHEPQEAHEHPEGQLARRGLIEGDRAAGGGVGVRDGGGGGVDGGHLVFLGAQGVHSRATRAVIP